MKNKRRPGWVWVISIFLFFSASFTLFSFYLVYSGKVLLQPAQKAYFASLTFMDLGLSILVGLTNLFGALLLFFLRKQAFYLFVISLTFNLLITTGQIFNKGFIQALPSGGIVGMLIGWGILVAICVYTKRLEKNGVLS